MPVDHDDNGYENADNGNNYKNDHNDNNYNASNDNSDSELDDGGITLNDQEESVVLHFSILYYAELLSTLLKLSLKLSHFIHIWTLNGLSFTLIDAILFLNMRSAIIKLKSKITSHMNYRNIVIALEKNSTTVEEISEIDDVSLSKRKSCLMNVLVS